MGYKKEGKAPMQLLNPDFLREIAKALEVGETKHAENHYLDGEGVPITEAIGAALRHIILILEGENIDEETGFYHTGHAAANLQIIDIYLKDLRRYKQCDDRRFNKSRRDMGKGCNTEQELQVLSDETCNGRNTRISTDPERGRIGRFMDSATRYLSSIGF